MMSSSMERIDSAEIVEGWASVEGVKGGVGGRGGVEFELLRLRLFDCAAVEVLALVCLEEPSAAATRGG